MKLCAALFRVRRGTYWMIRARKAQHVFRAGNQRLNMAAIEISHISIVLDANDHARPYFDRFVCPKHDHNAFVDGQRSEGPLVRGLCLCVDIVSPETWCSPLCVSYSFAEADRIRGTDRTLWLTNCTHTIAAQCAVHRTTDLAESGDNDDQEQLDT
jgi:hypothetical protein